MVTRRGGRKPKKFSFTLKKFGGKTYHSYSRHRTKAGAQSQARKLRARPVVSGARVITKSPGEHTVYVHVLKQ